MAGFLFCGLNQNHFENKPKKRREIIPPSLPRYAAREVNYFLAFSARL